MPLPYRLRLPGPTAVPDRVQDAIARPVVNHRGPEFRAVFDRAEELIRPILGTSHPVFFFASSGTGMMEAALVNVLAPGERALISAHGQFGERFAEIARSLGAGVETIETPWGRPLDPADVERRLAHAQYRAVVIVHNESSTGVVADIASIGALLRGRPELLVVDSVSGLGGIEMRQDEWGVDIVASSCQKALMCPPGIGILSMSPKAWQIVNRNDRLPRYYWDLRKAKEAVESSGTPFTTPVTLMAGVREALEMIHEEGLQQVLERHRRLSTKLRAGCQALGLPSFPKESLSNTVVCLEVPAPWDGRTIIRNLYDRHGTVIAGSRNQLEGRVIRIGTMGWVHDEDIATDLAQLKETLTGLKEAAHAR